MADVVKLTAGRMTETEYEREREKLRELYGDSNIEARAKRDQALATLFYRSGWTQEQLAGKEGVDRSRIARRLLFGRFLNFVLSSTKSNSLPNNLTETRFRIFWDQTDKTEGNDRIRFREVQRMIAEQTNISNSHVPYRLGPEIVDKFADGKWHQQDTITDHVEGDPERIVQTLHLMRQKGTYNSKCESKKVGTETCWRIFRQEKTISGEELIEKLGPIVKELKAEGRKSLAHISMSTVARLAALLERQIDDWTK